MLCSKCGHELYDGGRFCPACGAEVQSSPETVNQTAGAERPKTQQQPVSVPPKKSNKTGLIIAIVAIVLVGLLILGGIVAFAAVMFLSHSQIPFSFPWNKSESQEPAVSSAVVEQQQPELTEIVNDLISSYGVDGDVAVAVVDNNTGEEFFCDSSSESFTSWGFYLPVYMAFSDMYPDTYESYKANILSADPAKCNTAANFAINTFGSPAGITDYMQNNLHYRSTTFGRNFGEVNAAGDNYTTASEAAKILNQFNNQYHYSDLCYSPSSFGVTVPAGATMYAQIGSENRNVKNNLNVFAIVKGYNSDYSIAVLTQNKASATGIVNVILDTVHTQMEGNS